MVFEMDFREPDARIVEIEVYATIGTSWYELPKFRGMSAGSVAKVGWKSVATDEERAENGVKDVVKMVAVR